MQILEKMIDEDSAIEETLELMLNDNLRSEIEHSIQDAEEGKGIPADEFFKNMSED